MSTLAPETTAITPDDPHTDRRPTAWRLPADQTCANAARAHVRETLTAMALPGDLVYAAVTVASELAANALTHTVGAQRSDAVMGPPELWLHLVEHPEPRLVVSVFDADRHRVPTLDEPGALTESGRGMQIVAALSAHWGCRLTRSRVGPWHLPGKAIWAALPLPVGWTRARPTLPKLTPLVAADTLYAALTARGIDRIYRRGDGRLQVISVRTGLTVWVAETIHWRNDNGGYVHRHLDDVSDAVEHIVARHETLGLPRPASPAAHTDLV
jgi:hypothetical protein